MINPWRQFQGLLPAPSLYVVRVIAHNADGTSTVEMPGGGQFTVRGQDVAEDAYAFVRDGVIEGEAPAVTPVELEV